MGTLQASSEPWMIVSGASAWPSNPVNLTKPSKITSKDTPSVSAIQWSTSWNVPSGQNNSLNLKKPVDLKKEMVPILGVVPSTSIEGSISTAETDHSSPSSIFSSYTFISKDSKTQNPWAPQTLMNSPMKDKKSNSSPSSSNFASPNLNISQKKKQTPVVPPFQPASQNPAPVEPPQAPEPEKQQIEEELSKQNLYKTELCRSFSETGSCRYGHKCQFAHGQHELRGILRHPKYKTETCKTFSTTGSCPYGSRCRFIHPGSPSVSGLPQGSPTFTSNQAFSNNVVSSGSFSSHSTSGCPSDEDEQSEAGSSESSPFFQSQVFTPIPPVNLNSLSRKSSFNSLTSTPKTSPRLSMVPVVPSSSTHSQETEQTEEVEETEETEEARETARRLSFFARLTVN